MTETLLEIFDKPTFQPFPKIGRLSREIIVTEKIDGTNSSIHINLDADSNTPIIMTASRNRWITPKDDNFGFARWVEANEDQLIEELGEGSHFGEWWGSGIGRRYDMKEKVFSLFNTTRWKDAPLTLCRVVPVLYTGDFRTPAIEDALERLKVNGSSANPGFMNPEGVVIFHAQANVMFKKTIAGDEVGKGYGG